MLAADYREKARGALGRINWWPAILVSLVAAILGDGYHGSGASSYRDVWDNASPLVTDFSFSALWAAVAGVVTILTLIYIVLSLTLGSVIKVGKAQYFTKLMRDQEQSPFATLFHPFRYWTGCLALGLLTAVRVFLWTLLLVVPGIIASYSYAMAPYIKGENPHMTATEALNESVRIMRGKRWRLFCLQISFIGWTILSAITLGLGYLLLNPYMDAAEAAFYLENKN